MLLLLLQPAEEKTKLYKELKWTPVLKTMESVHCCQRLLFPCCYLIFDFFFHASPSMWWAPLKLSFLFRPAFQLINIQTTHSVTPVGPHAVGCLEDCTQTRLSRWHGHNPSSCVAKYLRKQTQTSYSESLIRNNIMHHHFQRSRF